MPKVRDFINQLMDPYRTQALKNIQEQHGKETLDKEIEGEINSQSIASAINSYMNWRKTHQGHNYWSKIHENIQDYI